MADSSFDVVSKVDRQEVDNALNQAAKELSTRFDFRGTDTTIAWKGDEVIELVSSTEERLKAAVDVFKEKLVRRDISMKAFDAGDPQPSGKTFRLTGTLKQGISTEEAKKITKLIRDEGPPRASRRRSRATRSASAPRSATTCRLFRRCCGGVPTSTSRCSSSTTAERVQWMAPSQPAEPGEAAISAQERRVVVDRVRAQIGVGHVVSAGIDLGCKLPEQFPMS